MAADGLRDKQRRFVEEYLIDLNATQAAIRAGYAPKSAEVTGHKLLRNAKVAAKLAEAQEARSKRTQVDADWVLRRLTDEATADLADIIDDAGSLRPVGEWPEIWRQGLVSGIDVHEEVVEGAKVGQTVKVKLSDRIKRIELIGRHVDVGAFKSTMEHTGKGGGPIKTEEIGAGATKLAEFLNGIAERSGTAGEPDA